jgi:L-ascorbate metabolism protein UlaG (beta-lactamase superfamily)
MSRARFLRKIIFDGRGRPLPPTAQPSPTAWRQDAITGSCLGHSTVLLNVFGFWVLTDPVFSTRVGPGVPGLILGPKRNHEPALAIEDLPTPDVILLSHGHFDHLDVWSLRYTPAFRRLGDSLHPIDLMLMPIGACDPWIRAHCNPEQAVAMARDAGARAFVSIHHKTFKLSNEPMDEPARRLRDALVDTPELLLAVRHGETFRVPLR